MTAEYGDYQENHVLVGEALRLFVEGMMPFIEKAMREKFGVSWKFEAELFLREVHGIQNVNWEDPHTLLLVMSRYRKEVFMKYLGHEGYSLVSELRNVRNRWAHMETFDDNDTFRALDTIWRLLETVSSPVASQAHHLKQKSLERLVGDGPEPKEVKPIIASDIKWNQLGFKPSFYAVHLHIDHGGHTINYQGRFSNYGSLKKEVSFTVDGQKSEDEELLSAVKNFIKENWSGDDEVKVLIVGDGVYRIKVGDSQEYEVKVKPEYNETRDRLLSCDFKRVDDCLMVPFGDIIGAVKNRLSR